MPCHEKSAPCQVVDFRNAVADFEDVAASFTMKVVMVRLAGQFVNRPRARDLERGEPSFIEKALDIAIDGCDPQAANLGFGGVQDLLRR